MSKGPGRGQIRSSGALGASRPRCPACSLSPALVFSPRSQSGFTLIEVIMALGVSAIVLAAIGGVFFDAMRLRARTSALINETAPIYQALDVIRNDLKSAVPPVGMIANTFRDGDVMTANGQGVGLQFCTSAGTLRNDVPWGDVEMVTYQLRDSITIGNGSRELVRSVTRNLLATATLDATDQLLLSNVRSMEIYCFDGSGWRNNWDSTLGDTNLPVAVRVSIQMAGETSYDDANRQPYVIYVPLVVQPVLSSTNDVDTATADTGTGTGTTGASTGAGTAAAGGGGSAAR
jgi:prepilin-type N-terminal cleavage/methylation domain-containing protein